MLTLETPLMLCLHRFQAYCEVQGIAADPCDLDLVNSANAQRAADAMVAKAAARHDAIGGADTMTANATVAVPVRTVTFRPKHRVTRNDTVAITADLIGSSNYHALCQIAQALDVPTMFFCFETGTKDVRFSVKQLQDRCCEELETPGTHSRTMSSGQRQHVTRKLHAKLRKKKE